MLLLYGTRDPAIGSRHATWWQRHLPSARVEMSPGAGHLLIIPMWHRVLSFLAPTGSGLSRARRPASPLDAPNER